MGCGNNMELVLLLFLQGQVELYRLKICDQ